MTTNKDIRYLNKDFSQFRENLIEFSKNYFPNTYNDFNESSPGMLFIEMASYVGDVLSYYTDSQLKESLLAYAGNKDNVISLAANLGYKPKNKVPAQVNLDVFQLLPAKSTVQGKEPDWDYALTVNEGMVVGADNSNIEFRTTALLNFSVSSSFSPTDVSVYQVNDVDNSPEYYLLKKQVPAVSGNVLQQSFTFTSAKKFDKIRLSDSDIIEIVSVTDSEGNEWTEVPYLAQDTVYDAVANTPQNDPDLNTNKDVPYLLKLRKTARRFVTRFLTDGSIELQFGSGISDNDDQEIIPSPDIIGSNLNGYYKQYDVPLDPSNFLQTKTYGLAPSNTTLTVKYTVGGGIESNVPSDVLRNINQIEYSIDETNLDRDLLDFVKQSIAVTNTQPAMGGRSEESIEEIRENALSFMSSQLRAVTPEDYVIRTYTMPAKFGSVAKCSVIADDQINPVTDTRISNPFAINLYTLGYDNNKSLTPLNRAVKENLRTYLSSYKMLTDAVNIKDAFIINIGIEFEIITYPEFNANEVLLSCIAKLKEIFNVAVWQINQPIVLSKIYSELDKLKGVQSVPKIKIVNLFDIASGYSGNAYDIAAATKSGVIYPSLDPSIFEIKYPNKDIVGKVTTI